MAHDPSWRERDRAGTIGPTAPSDLMTSITTPDPDPAPDSPDPPTPGDGLGTPAGDAPNALPGHPDPFTGGAR